MDSTVDDFLNEIDEIAPLKKSKVDNATYAWQECYDKSSGHKYYWNTKTDEVTWTKPTEYRTAEEAAKDKSSPSCKYLPPSGSPLFPSGGSSSAGRLPVKNESIRIYKIAEVSSVISNGSVETKVKENESGASNSSEFRNISNNIQSDCQRVPKEDDKITDDEEDDDEDILTKIQKRAKELDKNVKLNEKITKSDKAPTQVESALNLVAGYSDSEEEFEEETKNDEKASSINFIPEMENRVAHSTLFPIPQQIDINDFKEDNEKEGGLNNEKNHSDFDKKAFQRKRRIGVALVNTKPTKKREINEDLQENNDDDKQRTGLGYSKDNVYSNFSKGGVMFVKADVLNPANEKLEDQQTNCDTETKDNEVTIEKSKIESAYTTLKEKLAFLSEGRPEVSPVQIMIIQAETLFEAMQTGALQFDYLNKWLSSTCSDLIKLEKEATPDGWLLHWDRSNKRYYYQNEATGETQWEYPQPDVTRCDEAMDICTTPPPGGDDNIHISPPLPPAIRSPSPPPPPIISVDLEKVAESQPLPPGVEPEVKKIQNNPSLETALDTFYSDLAAIENSNSPPPEYANSGPASPSVDSLNEIKKKKKTKVKLAQGLSMKKKGVSQLVEKWKNVQMNYDN